MSMQELNAANIMTAAAAGEGAARVLRYMDENGGSVRAKCGTTGIRQYRFCGLDSSGLLTVFPASGARFLGVAADYIGANTTKRVRIGGYAPIQASAAIAAGDDLVAAGDGFAAPKVSTSISLATAIIGTDAQDDLTQTNLPDTCQAVCAADETGNTMVIRGLVGTTYTKETVTLGEASTYESTNTWAAIYSIEITAVAVGQITVEDGTSTANIIPTDIALGAAARHYGAIPMDEATDSKGHSPTIRVGGANASSVAIMGTDYSGAEQVEVLTMNGTTDVTATEAFRTVTHILLGADGIAFGAGATSQYTLDVYQDEDSDVVAWATAACATAGANVIGLLFPKNAGLVPGSVSLDDGVGRYLNGATAITEKRFVNLATTGLLAVSPAATGRHLGVSMDNIGRGQYGYVKSARLADVMPSCAIAKNDEIVAVVGGFAAPYQATAKSLGTAVIGADAQDDLTQTNLPDTVSAICAGIETGNMIVWGDVGGVLTKETVPLVGGAATYPTTNTWAAVYCIEFDTAAVGTIDVEDGTGTAAIIPAQIAALTAARKYGAIVPDVTTDSEGHVCTVVVGGANATVGLIYGTDYAGNEQYERVTFNGTTTVTGTLAFRTFSHLFIGADGIAFNAGVTSQYTMDTVADNKRDILAYAVNAQAVAGSSVEVFMLPQPVGLVVGESPSLFYTALEASWGGGGVSNTYTVPGIAASDVIHATMASCTNAVAIQHAVRSADDTVTVTFTADPGAATIVGLTVYRP